MLNEGKTVYFGDALQSVTYFTNLGYSFPEYSNPADYLFDIIKGPSDKEGLKSSELVEVETSDKNEEPFWKIFDSSDNNKQVQKVLETISNSNSTEQLVDSITKKKSKTFDQYPISRIKQTAILTRRLWVATTRDSSIMLVRTGAALGIGLVIIF